MDIKYWIYNTGYRILDIYDTRYILYCNIEGILDI